MPPSRVQEQSKTINQFTAGQLENCDLLILSDVQHMTKDLVGLFKALVGRDSIAKERKYEKEISLINPSCQLIIVSNFPPSNFPQIANDEGMMDRIIQVTFDESDRIPADLQLANLEVYLKKMIPDVFNWAIHSPPELFQYHIRNQFYKTYLLAERRDAPQGFEAFLMDVFVFDTDPNSFTPMEELEMAMKEYLDKTGDPFFDEILKKRIPKKFLSNFLPTFAYETFERKIISGRYSARKPTIVGEQSYQRPYGFKNLSRRNKDGSLEPSQQNFEKRKFEDLERQLPEKYENVRSVSWVETSYPDFLEVQRNILRRRQIERSKLEAQEKANEETLSNETKGELSNETKGELKTNEEKLPNETKDELIFKSEIDNSESEKISSEGNRDLDEALKGWDDFKITIS